MGRDGGGFSRVKPALLAAGVKGPDPRFPASVAAWERSDNVVSFPPRFRLRQTCVGLIASAATSSVAASDCVETRPARKPLHEISRIGTFSRAPRLRACFPVTRGIPPLGPDWFSAVSTSASANPASASACDAPSAAQSEWFRQEVHAHDEQLKSYLRIAFPTVRDVDDIVQESYLRTWRRQSCQPIRAAKAFLFTVARRLSIDWLRREQTSVVEAVEDLEALPVSTEGRSTADLVAQEEITALLVAAVEALPARCREVVILRKFQLLSARETALRLGLKEATVEMQLSRGNARIRAHLAARGITSVLGHDA